MSEPVHPILVRVPEPLADALTAQAADAGCSRHALILDKLQHDCGGDDVVEVRGDDGQIVHRITRTR